MIVTVSGYRGFERFKLIRLIATTGAVYVGRMNRSVTHVICWKHQGKKYRLAKRLKVAIVNHHWIEECVKRGTIVPVEPYTFRSGEEIGPLSADVPLCMKQEKPQPKPVKKAKKLSCSRHSNFRRLRKGYSTPPEPQGKRRRLVKNCSNLDNWLSRKEEHSEGVAISSKRNSHRVDSIDLDMKGRVGTSKKLWLNENSTDENDSGHDVKGIDVGYHENRATQAGDASTPVLTSEKVTQAACEDLSTPGHDNFLPRSNQPSCVICLTDFSSTRGVLPCGHRFCFSCIQSWADHTASRNKLSTCPLCKASFICISRMEATVTSDQKIYSQSVPEDSARIDFFVLPEQTCGPPISASAPPVCFRCSSKEPEDLLIRCQFCQIRCVHSFCLDPPLFPWTCNHCKDLRMLY
ncbi:zinc finger family protein, partial [Genlisea aurea]